jgi:hypothetical protein
MVDGLGLIVTDVIGVVVMVLVIRVMVGVVIRVMIGVMIIRVAVIIGLLDFRRDGRRGECRR